MKRFFLHLILAASALALSIVSLFVVLQGASDEPYMAFRSLDAICPGWRCDGSHGALASVGNRHSCGDCSSACIHLVVAVARLGSALRVLLVSESERLCPRHHTICRRVTLSGPTMRCTGRRRTVARCYRRALWPPSPGLGRWAPSHAMQLTQPFEPGRRPRYRPPCRQNLLPSSICRG